MKTIHKYELIISHEQEVFLSAGAEILHVDNQAGELCMWALVDTDAAIETVEIRIYGTGEDIDKSMIGYRYIGTVLLMQDRLASHVYAWDATS